MAVACVDACAGEMLFRGVLLTALASLIRDCAYQFGAGELQQLC